MDDEILECLGRWFRKTYVGIARYTPPLECSIHILSTVEAFESPYPQSFPLSPKFQASSTCMEFGGEGSQSRKICDACLGRY